MINNILYYDKNENLRCDKKKKKKINKKEKNNYLGKGMTDRCKTSELFSDLDLSWFWRQKTIEIIE